MIPLLRRTIHVNGPWPNNIYLSSAWKRSSARGHSPPHEGLLPGVVLLLGTKARYPASFFSLTRRPAAQRRSPGSEGAPAQSEEECCEDLIPLANKETMGNGWRKNNCEQCWRRLSSEKVLASDPLGSDLGDEREWGGEDGAMKSEVVECGFLGYFSPEPFDRGEFGVLWRGDPMDLGSQTR
ncbi:hypothetical protein Droror1_Dr00024255 [Drosera rotundifolia]